MQFKTYILLKWFRAFHLYLEFCLDLQVLRCFTNLFTEKERRLRRPARPVSPGYSTDSNYGTIDLVRKPYPKSQRKQQLLDQGKW